MAMSERKSNAVEMPNSLPHSERTDAIEPVLLQELKELNPQEQLVLCELIKRTKRDRSINGPVDELAVIVNGLRDFSTEDDWLFFLKLNEKIAPNLHKEFVGAEKIKLETELPSMTKSISEAINSRTSARDFNGSDLSFEKLNILLGQSCGVRDTIFAYNRRDVALRNFPTVGGLQCTELYLVVNGVSDLSQGLYHYNPMKNCLELIEKGNFRWRVVNCCPNHEWLSEASVVIFIAPDVSRLTWKYGAYKSYRLAHLETGVVSQNLHLVATALELGSCMVFGFDDEHTDSLLELDGRREFTTLVIAFGNKVDKKSLLRKVTNRNDSISTS